jgi:hypothetical protein
MYNNSYFQKLINNVQAAPKQSTSITSQNGNFNIVDMKKKKSANISSTSDGSSGPLLASNIMIKTSYGGSMVNAVNSNSYVMNTV